MNAPAPEASTFQVSSVSAFSTATRVAGAVVALGYLLGLVPGPVVAVVGGIALITYGRNLLLERSAAVVSGASLAVLGGALGISALRWGALELDAIRGVQSVLGPTVLVGPTQAAIGAGIAVAGSAVALAVWSATPWPRGRFQTAWWGLELIIGAFAVVTVFLDPAQSALDSGGFGPALLQIARWAGVIAAVALLVGGLAWLLHRTRHVWRAVAVAIAGAAVVTSAALTLSVV